MHTFPRKGFTLVELLTVIAISSILLSIGLPSLQYLITNSKATTLTNSLTNIIRSSRHYAISNWQPVTICSSTDGRTCVTSQTWTDSVLAFADTNGNAEVDAGERVLSYYDTIPEDFTLSWKNFTRRPFFQYRADGTSPALNGSFSICPQSGELLHSRQIIINRQGRARLARDSDGDGIVNAANGRNMSC